MGFASREQEWDFDFPPTLVEIIFQNVAVQARWYLQRLLLLHGGTAVRVTAGTDSWTKLPRLTSSIGLSM